jgi:hypothetical protein
MLAESAIDPIPIVAIAQIIAVETAVTHVVGCDPRITIGTAVTHVVKGGPGIGISHDELAAEDQMIQDALLRIVCDGGAGDNRAQHQQGYENLHDPSPLVEIGLHLMALTPFCKFARELAHLWLINQPSL